MSTSIAISVLYAIDNGETVLARRDDIGSERLNYCPYGHTRVPATKRIPAFNGLLLETLSNTYLLGDGHRSYGVVLMRFNTPDLLSPFGAGGLNSYAYCHADPLNKVDKDGRTPKWLKRGLRRVGLMSQSASATAPVVNRMTQRSIDGTITARFGAVSPPGSPPVSQARTASQNGSISSSRSTASTLSADPNYDITAHQRRLEEQIRLGRQRHLDMSAAEQTLNRLTAQPGTSAGGNPRATRQMHRRFNNPRRELESIGIELPPAYDFSRRPEMYRGSNNRVTFTMRDIRVSDSHA